VPHPSLGEIVVLVTVVVPGTTVDEAEVRAFLRGRLAPYKVPRRVLAFRKGELAFTSTQKVQLEPLRKRVLARLCAERAEVAGHVYGPE
jgi:acyl-CoA synthetase (AMP-forming)/AMP-acid ligase II